MHFPDRRILGAILQRLNSAHSPSRLQIADRRFSHSGDRGFGKVSDIRNICKQALKRRSELVLGLSGRRGVRQLVLGGSAERSDGRADRQGTHSLKPDRREKALNSRRLLPAPSSAESPAQRQLWSWCRFLVNPYVAIESRALNVLRNTSWAFEPEAGRDFVKSVRQTRLAYPRRSRQ